MTKMLRARDRPSPLITLSSPAAFTSIFVNVIWAILADVGRFFHGDTVHGPLIQAIGCPLCNLPFGVETRAWATLFSGLISSLNGDGKFGEYKTGVC